MEITGMIALYEMPEWSEYDFQFRRAACGGDAFELHPGDAPPLNRGQIMRFVPSSGRGPYLRMTN